LCNTYKLMADNTPAQSPSSVCPSTKIKVVH
jgi:hypothetical protein